jgi:hypothetical protein
LSFAGLAQSQLNKLYDLSKGTVNPKAVSTPLIDNTAAFGTCNCDRTLNQCDAYCCCDTECSDAILQFWKSNYDAYCAKSYTGGKEYKPFSQCIDKKHIFNYNQRMGMQVSVQNGQLCVELDTGSMFSEYQNYIPEINQTMIESLAVKNELSKVLHG